MSKYYFKNDVLILFNLKLTILQIFIVTTAAASSWRNKSSNYYLFVLDKLSSPTPPAQLKFEIIVIINQR